MQLEDQTFLTVMDKLMAIQSKPRPKSALTAKLKSVIDYRVSLIDQDNYLYVFGVTSGIDTSISLADLKEIVKELES